MAKRNLENLYIPVNRATNEEFRKGYDGIRWDRPKKITKKAIKEILEVQLLSAAACRVRTENRAFWGVGCDAGQFLE